MNKASNEKAHPTKRLGVIITGFCLSGGDSTFRLYRSSQRISPCHDQLIAHPPTYHQRISRRAHTRVLARHSPALFFLFLSQDCPSEQLGHCASVGGSTLVGTHRHRAGRLLSLRRHGCPLQLQVYSLLPYG